MSPAALCVVLDSDVLWSGCLRDVLLELAFQRRFEPYWCPRILSALARHLEPHLVQKRLAQLKRQRPREGEEALLEEARGEIHDKISGKLLPTIRRVFPHATIERRAYEGLLDFCQNDIGDRHVLATAIASGSTRILTYNIKDFPESSLAPWGVRACTPDEFLSTELDPAHIYRALVSVCARYGQPPMTPGVLTERLASKHGMRRSMDRVRDHMGSR